MIHDVICCDKNFPFPSSFLEDEFLRLIFIGLLRRNIVFKNAKCYQTKQE